MSEEVEKRIVSLEFDGSKFDSKLKKSQKSLEKFKKSLDLDKEIRSFDELEKAADINLNPLEKSLVVIEKRFDALEMVAFSVINRITNKAIDAGKKLVASLSIDNASAGWNKYEQQITAVQTLMTQVNAEKEKLTNPEESLFVNFNDDVQKMEYIEKFYERISAFGDETSAGVSEAMSALSKFTSQGYGLNEAEQATYGIYTLTASVGRSLREGAENAALFSKIAGRSLMAADMYSLQARGLNSNKFMQTLLDVASQGVKTADGKIEPTLKKVEGGYISLSKASDTAGLSVENLSGKYKAAANSILGTANVLKSTKTEIGATSDQLITLANASGMLSDKWARGEFVMEVLKQYGSFWNELEPVIEETGVGATVYSKALREYKKAFKENEETGELELKYAEHIVAAQGMLSKASEGAIDEKTALGILVTLGRQDVKQAETILKAYGWEEDEIKKWTANLIEGNRDLARESFLSLQEATKLSEAIEATKVAVAGRFTTMFQSIFGNYLEARDMFTNLSEWLYERFVTPIDNVAQVVKTWRNKTLGLEVLVTDEDGNPILDEDGTLQFNTEPIKFKNIITDDAGNIFSETGKLLYEEVTGTGFEALRSLFRDFGHLIDQFIDPIKEAFSEIFWDLDINTLTNGIVKLKTAVQSLIADPTIYSTMYAISETVFALIRSIGSGIKFILKITAPLRQLLVKLAGTLSSAAANFADFLGNLSLVGNAFSEGAEEANAFNIVVAGATKLVNSLSAIFADIVAKLGESEVWAKLKEIGSTIFGALATLISSVLGAIADGLTGLYDILINSGFLTTLTSFLSGAVELITALGVGLITGATELISRIVDIFKGGFSSIGKINFGGAKQFATNLWAFFKEVLKGLTSFISGAASDGTLVDFIKAFLDAVVTVIKSLWKEFTAAIEVLIEALFVILANMWTKFKPLLLDIVVFLASLIDFAWWNNVAKTLRNIGIGILFIVVPLGALTLALKAFVEACKGFKASRNPLTLTAQAFEDFLSSLEIKQKANLARSRLLGFATIILSFVAMFAVIAGAVYLLKDVPMDKIISILKVMIGSMAIMIGMVALLVAMISSLDNLSESTSYRSSNKVTGIMKGRFSGSGEQQTNGLMGVAMVLLSVAGIMVAMGYAFKLIADAFAEVQAAGVPIETFGDTIRAFLIGIGFIMVSVVALAMQADKLQAVALRQWGGGQGISKGRQGADMFPIVMILLSVAALALGLAKAAQMLATIPADVFKSNVIPTFIALGIFLAAVFVAIGIISKMTKSKEAVTAVAEATKGMKSTLMKVAVFFLAVSTAVAMLSGALVVAAVAANMVAGTDLSKFVLLAVIVGMLMNTVIAVAMIAGNKKSFNVKNVVVVLAMLAAVVSAMVGAIMLMALAAVMVQNVKMGSLWQLVGMVGIIGICVTALMAFSASMDEGDLRKMVGGMGVFSVVMVALIGAISVLALVANLVSGTDMGAFGKLSLIFGAFMLTMLAISAVLAAVSDVLPYLPALIQIISGAILAAAGALVLSAAAMWIAVQAIIDLGSHIKEVQNIVEVLKDLITFISDGFVNTGGMNMLAFTAFAVGLVIISSALVAFGAAAVLFAMSVGILGSGLKKLAEGIDAFNDIDYSGILGFTDTVAIVVMKILGIFSAFLLVIGLINDFTAGMASAGLIAIATSIMLIVTSVTLLVLALTKMFELLSRISTVNPFDQIKKNIQSLSEVVMMIINIFANALGLLFEKFASFITSIAESDAMTNLGYALGQAIGKAVVGVIGGVIAGVWQGAQKLIDKIRNGKTRDEVASTAVSMGKSKGGIMDVLFGGIDESATGEGLIEKIKNSNLLGEFKGIGEDLKGSLSSIGTSVTSIDGKMDEQLNWESLSGSQREVASVLAAEKNRENAEKNVIERLSMFKDEMGEITSLEQAEAAKARLGDIAKDIKYYGLAKDEDVEAAYDPVYNAIQEGLTKYSKSAVKTNARISAGTGGKVMYDYDGIIPPASATDSDLSGANKGYNVLGGGGKVSYDYDNSQNTINIYTGADPDETVEAVLNALDDRVYAESRSITVSAGTGGKVAAPD